ncbi:MAG: RHS repeat-associated protein [Glaciecola sp.]|jgi:RHS repeat-associated protein
MGCLSLSQYKSSESSLKIVHSAQEKCSESCINPYRYGFNGMEKDTELKSGNDDYDFGARLYDSRLGRFKSVDPLSDNYPHMSPYCYAANSPIYYIDENGEGPREGNHVLDIDFNISVVSKIGDDNKSFRFSDPEKKEGQTLFKILLYLNFTPIKQNNAKRSENRLCRLSVSRYPTR